MELSHPFSRELLQVITLPMQSGAGVVQHPMVLPWRRGELSLDKWTILEGCPWAAHVPMQPENPAASPHFSWSPDCSRGHIIFLKAIGKRDRPGIWCFQLRHSFVFSTDPAPSDIGVRLETVRGKQQLNSTMRCQECGGEHKYLKEGGQETTSQNKGDWGG